MAWGENYKPAEPFAHWEGPKRPKLLLLGEAWGKNEAGVRRPFVGESGKELWRLLGEALPHVAPEEHARVSALHRHDLMWIHHRGQWIEEASIAMTNVMALHPLGDKFDILCGSKGEVEEGRGKGSYTLPPIDKGKYLHPRYFPEIERLRVELAEARPNLVVALGAKAAWAMLQATAIGTVRGAIAHSDFVLGDLAPLKVLPTYHPAALFRTWAWRPIVLADLQKAARERLFPEIRRPKRRVLVSPTLAEVQTWTRETLESSPRLLGPDIETAYGQITCIGFARARDDVMVVPFVDLTLGNGSYWGSSAEEYAAWCCVRALLESPIPKVWQNGLYDMQYLWKMGILPRANAEDTMLLHHSLFPEMQKGLGFLGSIYCNESEWKTRRRKRASEPGGEKKDE